MCGEQHQACILHIQGVGSPPRVRGTAYIIRIHACKRRITPACAGNSLAGIAKPVSKTDHPRVCGEQHSIFLALALYVGSPPRVRGTALPWRKCNASRRITPACAGNRRRSHRGVASIQDHPRVCGEQALPPASVFKEEGSPPRVRGTVQLDFAGLNCARITPACAGNSPPILSVYMIGKDHPRVCGEQLFCLPYAVGGEGSPPRVRGTDHALS